MKLLGSRGFSQDFETISHFAEQYFIMNKQEYNELNLKSVTLPHCPYWLVMEIEKL
jgi:hypothetical protein